MYKKIILAASSIVLIGAFTFTVRTGFAAGLDCGNAETSIDKMICSSPELSKLNEELEKTYKKTLAALDDEETKSRLFTFHQDRLERRAFCRPLQSGVEDRKAIIACLTRGISSRIAELKEIIPEWGRVTMLKNDPASQKACSALLDKSNIIWNKDSFGIEHYTVNIPAGFSEPEWSSDINNDAVYATEIKSAKFDFFNNREPVPVYTIRYEGTRTHHYTHIVVSPSEEETIRNRLPKTNLKELAQLEADLSYVRQVKSSATANLGYLKKEKLSPLKSLLFDASNTKLYDGWYTRSKFLRHDGKTYLVAWSNGGPSVTLFSPDKTGNLEPLCYHRGVPGSTKPNITMIRNPPFSCPATLGQIPIAWSSSHTAVIDLPEWGGKRPIKKDNSAMGSSGTGTSKLYIGPVNAASADKRQNWTPLSALKERHEDSVELHLTDKGAYVAVYSDDMTGDRPLITTYHRIDKNTLIPVCSVIMEDVPPAGYKKG